MENYGDRTWLWRGPRGLSGGVDDLRELLTGRQAAVDDDVVGERGLGGLTVNAFAENMALTGHVVKRCDEPWRSPRSIGPSSVPP